MTRKYRKQLKQIYSKSVECKISVQEWSGLRDLNARPQRPERCALAKLSQIPTKAKKYLGKKQSD